MRNYTASDAPLFLRAGIERSQVKVLNSDADFEKFKTTVGISFSGYGFAQDETIHIPDLPVIPTKAGEESMKIISVPSRPGAAPDQRVYLVEVEREKNGNKFKSWLNLRRLTERSFVDQKYADDFREEMATNYTSDFERLQALRGAKIVSEGTTEMRRYKFTDNGPELDDSGKRVEDTPATVTTVSVEYKKK